MKFVLLNKYYPPYNASTSHLLGDLSRELAKTHDVSIITGSTAYARDDAALRPPKSENIDGVSVRRVWCLGAAERSTLGRMVDYLSFYVTSFFRLLFHSRFDVVVVMTTPPFLAIPAVIASRLRGSKLILWNMDLYPDALVANGILSEKGLFYRMLSRLAGSSFRRCDRIIAIDRYMALKIKNIYKVPHDRIFECSNWERPLNDASQRPRRNALSTKFREEIGAEKNSVVFLYFGNLSIAHETAALEEGIQVIVERYPQALFVFVGGGIKYEALKRFVHSHRIKRVHFLGYVPKEEIAAPLLAADVGLVLLKSTFSGIGSPSKLYSLMAAGLPVIYLGPAKSEVAEVLREVDFGFQADDSDSSKFIKVCENYLENADLRARHGRNSLKAFNDRYEKSIVLSRLISLLALPVQQ